MGDDGGAGGKPRLNGVIRRVGARCRGMGENARAQRSVHVDDPLEERPESLGLRHDSRESTSAETRSEW